MSKEGWIVAAFIVVGLILFGVVAFTLRRKGDTGTKRGKVRFRGPFGLGGEAEASDELSPGVRITDAQSHAGGLTAEDKTGRGVDVTRVTTKRDINVTNTPPPDDPKE